MGLVSEAGMPAVNSQVTFFYYENLTAPEDFYGELLGLEKTFDKGWVKFFRITAQSYVGLVASAEGHHKSSDSKAVMLSIETPDLEAWYARVSGRGAAIEVPLNLDRPTNRLVTTFLLRDPGGYSVEFFRFNADA
jgi:predicted enzyme related to lactoylglutathione lyase